MKYRRWPSYRAWRRKAVLPALNAETRTILRAAFISAVWATPPTLEQFIAYLSNGARKRP